jgi:hypothetical protein
MAIPYDTDFGSRNAVLLALAGEVNAIGGADTVVAIAPSAGETHPNWVMFLNRIIVGANSLGVSPQLPTYDWLDYSVFQSVVNKVMVALENLTSTPPTVIDTPHVTGTGVVGNVLSCTMGNWNGAPSSYAYQWLRNGTTIAGATASTYTLVAADSGTNVSCRVIATNAAGPSSPSVSNAIAVA